MRKFASLISTPLLFLSLLCNMEAQADSGRICFPTLPGVEGNRLNVLNEIVLQKVILGPKGQQGYIATEYLGAPNLQASIYLKTDDGYCLLGDFDGVTSVSIEKNSKVGGLFNVRTKSVSGAERFIRSYRYVGERYRLIDCYVKNEKNMSRRCAEAEK